MEIDSLTRHTPLKRPWKNGIAVGRAYDLMRSDLQDHLRWLQREVGFRSCRFHALFHDDMNVVQRCGDKLVYQWHHVDKIYDFLLSIGLKPFVELNPMPAALASGPDTMFFYQMNITPPRVWSEWQDLVAAFAEHCVARYGLTEVRSWNFEVWNEPNLSGFWSGNKEDYFQLYAHAARGVKSVDGALKIGGPASSKAYWLADLIEYCQRENVPIDFVSTHLYPQDEFVEHADRESSPHAAGQFFQDTVRAAKATVEASSMPHLPIHWTEWNTQLATSAKDVTWGNNRYVDSLHAGSFVARQMVELDDAAETFTYWVASDIFEEGPIPSTPFSSTYGLLTIHGLPKASGNAFRFLERLRGPRLGIKSENFLPFCGAVATQEGDSIHVLLWNDVPPEVISPVTWNEKICLKLPQFSPEKWLLTRSCIRAGAGSAFESWEAIGKPIELSPSQLDAFRVQSEPAVSFELLELAESGIEMNVTLGPNEVLHLELRACADSADQSNVLQSAEETAKLEAQLGEISRA
ncbi:MAG: beta-xylosidase [Verrucomicrobia bacterium]|nr:MAG: beta-xylosidase [Verrucomicrobiota bacterium]